MFGGGAVMGRPPGPAHSPSHNPAERLRDAVIERLRHDELTAAQLAERLGLAHGTVGTLLSRLHREGAIEPASYTRRDIRWRAVPAREVVP